MLASDLTTSALIEQPASRSQQAVDDRMRAIGPVLIAADPAVKAAAIAATGEAIDGFFKPAPNPGLVTYPDSTEPGTAVGRVFEVLPSDFPAGTVNFHDLPTTFGAGVIKVRSTGGLSKWGNSLTPGGQRPTAGDAITLATVEVGATDGVSRVRIGGLEAGLGAKTLGGVVSAQFNTNDFKYFRWTIGSAGTYALQRYTGASFVGGTTTTLLSTGTVAKAGDLVDLSFDRADGVLALAVNGAIAGMWQASEAIRAAHQNATHAGMWALATTSNANYFGGWQWVAAYPSGTVTRQLVSVGTEAMFPKDVKLAPSQKRDAVGPVFDIRDFGGKVDARYLTDARTQAGQNYLWSDAYSFTQADVGKRVGVRGAGPVIANANDGAWLGTIMSIDGSAARLDSNATSTVTGARAVFGTTDDVAVAKAQIAAVRAGGGTVFFPPGRTIVTSPLRVENFVSWAGRRDLSWVHVIQDSPGDGGTAGTSDWLTCAGRDATTPLTGAHFFDFGVNAEFHIHSAGYGSAVKPLNIYYVQRCSIQRMSVWRTPATSIPFDHSFDQVTIRDNFILDPGRLAPSGIGPGGSGIGAGTKGTGATEPTLIENNTIVGTQSAAVSGPGHNGIFTEAQTGANPDLGTIGYRIVNNVIQGMPFGISDTGSTGTIIEGNQIIGCGTGIRLSATTLPASYPGLHAIIRGNVIRGSTGPGATDGTGIAIFTQTGRANTRAAIHAIIEGNQIFEGTGWGIRVHAIGVDVEGIMICGNVIRANGLSGIRLLSDTVSIVSPHIAGNQIVGNGRRAVAGDQVGVLVAPGTIVKGGRIQDNDIYDVASTPTQVAEIMTTGATLTGVRRTGNTGDA
jgi:hypothetical protein